MKIFIPLPLLFMFFYCKDVGAEKLIVASDVWCPYICADENKPGYMVELIQEIFSKKGFKLDLQIIPLTRALTLSQKNKIDMVLGLTQEHIDTYQIERNQISIGDYSNDFFVSNTNDWRYTTDQALEDYLNNNHTIGIIKGYVYGDFIDQLISQEPEHFIFAHGDSPIFRNIQMLKRNRIQILLDTKNTVLFEAKKNFQNDLVYAGTQGDRVLLYVGFSPSFSTDKKILLDQGIIEYRQSGELATLLKKYGIYDWQ